MRPPPPSPCRPLPSFQALAAEHLALAASADDAGLLSGRLVSAMSSADAAAGVSPLPLWEAMLLLPMGYSVASGGVANGPGGAMPYEDESAIKVGPARPRWLRLPLTCAMSSRGEERRGCSLGHSRWSLNCLVFWPQDALTQAVLERPREAPAGSWLGSDLRERLIAHCNPPDESAAVGAPAEGAENKGGSPGRHAAEGWGAAGDDEGWGEGWGGGDDILAGGDGDDDGDGMQARMLEERQLRLEVRRSPPRSRHAFCTSYLQPQVFLAQPSHSLVY